MMDRDNCGWCNWRLWFNVVVTPWEETASVVTYLYFQLHAGCKTWRALILVLSRRISTAKCLVRWRRCCFPKLPCCELIPLHYSAIATYEVGWQRWYFTVRKWLHGAAQRTRGHPRSKVDQYTSVLVPDMGSMPLNWPREAWPGSNQRISPRKNSFLYYWVAIFL